MEENIKFIEENYIEEKELCSQAKIQLGELNRLIENEMIPTASFIIETNKEIRSPLGDQITIQQIKKYYSKNTVDLIQENRIIEESSEIKKQFKSHFIKALVDNKDKKYAYGNLFGANGALDNDKLDSVFEEEWKYYCQGVYGICTLNANASEIAKKEIAVKKLIKFNEEVKDRELTVEEREILKSLNTEYNSISNLFAPYQRETSSRGKYLDKILRLNSLDDLIK